MSEYIPPLPDGENGLQYSGAAQVKFINIGPDPSLTRVMAEVLGAEIHQFVNTCIIRMSANPALPFHFYTQAVPGAEFRFTSNYGQHKVDVWTAPELQDRVFAEKKMENAYIWVFGRHQEQFYDLSSGIYIGTFPNFLDSRRAVGGGGLFGDSWRQNPTVPRGVTSKGGGYYFGTGERDENNNYIELNPYLTGRRFGQLPAWEIDDGTMEFQGITGEQAERYMRPYNCEGGLLNLNMIAERYGFGYTFDMWQDAVWTGWPYQEWTTTPMEFGSALIITPEDDAIPMEFVNGLGVVRPEIITSYDFRWIERPFETFETATQALQNDSIYTGDTSFGTGTFWFIYNQNPEDFPLGTGITSEAVVHAWRKLTVTCPGPDIKPSVVVHPANTMPVYSSNSAAYVNYWA